MADLARVLADRTTYPDDREIDFHGEKVTLKELRDSLIPKGDFTRATQQHAERERQLQTAVEGYQQQLAEALKAQQTAGAVPPGGVTREALLADPVLGPLVKDLTEAKEQLRATQERVQMHEQGYLRDRYQQELNSLSFTDENDRKAFLDFSIQNRMTNLPMAHRLYTRDRDLEAATKKARDEGVEAGRKQAAATPIPLGSRRAIAPKPEGPTSLWDPKLEEIATNDPEIQAALRGEAPV